MLDKNVGSIREQKIILTQSNIRSWLSQVDGTLLCMVIIFQNVVLVPKSRWLRAIKEVTTNEDMKYLSDELYWLIGKLQSYENENTEDI